MIFDFRVFIFASITFSLIALYGAICFVKFILSKNKSFDNIKELLIIYGSWIMLWLWTFNNSFYLTYSFIIKYGEMGDNLGEALKFFVNATHVFTIFIIIMFLVASLLEKKIKKHIAIGSSIYFLLWISTDYGSYFAELVTPCKLLPQGLVRFFNIGYNVFFWCYVIGFLVYGIYYKKHRKGDK